MWVFIGKVGILNVCDMIIEVVLCFIFGSFFNRVIFFGILLLYFLMRILERLEIVFDFFGESL